MDPLSIFRREKTGFFFLNFWVRKLNWNGREFVIQITYRNTHFHLYFFSFFKWRERRKINWSVKRETRWIFTHFEKWREKREGTEQNTVRRNVSCNWWTVLTSGVLGNTHTDGIGIDKKKDGMRDRYKCQDSSFRWHARYLLHNLSIHTIPFS